MSESTKLKSLFDWKLLSERECEIYEKSVEEVKKAFPERVLVIHKKITPVSFDKKLTRIGLEVEVENLEDGPVLTFWWQAKSDPSLRNYGFELFSSFPYSNHED